MKIHMIGHASLFIETKDCRILMDPVFWDPFYEDRNETCPKREVIIENLPEFDFLVISHSHLDHFDIRTLAHLPKTVDVLIPQDKLIENYLLKLGYSQIYALKDFDEVRIGSTNLQTTRSENRVPEFGIVVSDDSGTFWNQVDTDVSSTTISNILSKYSEIDFLLATWQPMLEACYQLNQSISFPYIAYSQLLYKIALIQPQGIAPGANGFKYVDDAAWLNQIAFPVTREKFCQDIQEMIPKLGGNIFALDPGDILTFCGSDFSYSPAACNYVNKLDNNRDSIVFAPVKAGNKLIDSNCQKSDIDDIKKVIKQEILFDFPKFLEQHLTEFFLEHQKWKVIYQLEVIFADDSIFQWLIDFSNEKITTYQGFNPLANFFSYTTASHLYGRLKGALGPEYTMDSGCYRSYQKVYSVHSLGFVYPAAMNVSLEDPLLLRFSNIFQEKKSNPVLDRAVEKWSNAITKEPSRAKTNNSMLKFEGVLLKPTKRAK